MHTEFRKAFWQNVSSIRVDGETGLGFTGGRNGFEDISLEKKLLVTLYPSFSPGTTQTQDIFPLVRLYIRIVWGSIIRNREHEPKSTNGSISVTATFSPIFSKKYSLATTEFS